jgi:hypothetical protein
VDAVQRILAIAERERRKRQSKVLTNQIATKNLIGDQGRTHGLGASHLFKSGIL